MDTEKYKNILKTILAKGAVSHPVSRAGVAVGKRATKLLETIDDGSRSEEKVQQAIVDIKVAMGSLGYGYTEHTPWDVL